MPPKFQSSFIPKGPITTSAAAMSSMRRAGETSFLSTLAFFIFSASVLAALGVFGYRFFLEYRIRQMTGDLAEAHAAIDSETIGELTSLNNRIVSTENLVSAHQLVTPLLELLEKSTPKSVRFTSLNYSRTKDGLELNLSGEARGYAALALQADVFNKSRYFRSTSFSDLTLNDKGDVEFSFKGLVHPDLVSYAASFVPEVEVDLPTGFATSTSQQ